MYNYKSLFICLFAIVLIGCDRDRGGNDSTDQIRTESTREVLVNSSVDMDGQVEISDSEARVDANLQQGRDPSATRTEENTKLPPGFIVVKKSRQ